MARFKCVAIVLALVAPGFLGNYAWGASKVAREVIALYSGASAERARYTRIHQLAQVPLNHLGLKISYYDVRDGLPSQEAVKAARGIISWFPDTGAVPKPQAYVRWLETVAATDTKFVLLGHPGFALEMVGTRGHEVLRRLGVDWTGERVRVTFDASVKDRIASVTNFERQIPRPLPAFPVVHSTDDSARSWVVVESGSGRRAQVIMTSNRGGFVAKGYAVYRKKTEDGHWIRAWLIDPFRFFADAYATGGVPAPDVTTRAGRRIYYSHIDGDGWRNPTRIERYKETDARELASRVILNEVIDAYPRLPVTVAPIAADLDPQWHGTERARAVAHALFRRPQVEVGSHTYSHPFSWEFFAHEGHRERERAFFGRYPGSARLVGVLGRVRSALGLTTVRSGFEGVAAPSDYDRPRAYAIEPFSIDREIEGARAKIAELLPAGKSINTYQWSGDTAPFPAMLSAVADSSMVNINGGDTRFDPEYPSYAWTAPIGIAVGDEWQVFSSNSNENTYTENWTDRFFGFKYLKQTAKNTNRPRRISAFNIYYHMFSGNREASLSAVKSNLDYARERPVIPLRTSHYARIAQGFRTISLERLSVRRWVVHDRGHLQTLRFDHALFDAVDFPHSIGVIGQRRLHGSLYVALDPEEAEPVVALRGGARPDRPPAARRAYLIQSAWDVRDVAPTGSGVSFTAGGYTDGWMEWHVPQPGPYRIAIRVNGGKSVKLHRTVGADHSLILIPGSQITGPWPKGPVRVTIRPESAS